MLMMQMIGWCYLKSPRYEFFDGTESMMWVRILKFKFQELLNSSNEVDSARFSFNFHPRF